MAVDMDTNTTAVSPASNSNSSANIPQTSPLLSLPPELRNDITEMVVNDIPEKTLNLLTAIPPGNGLLCTCRQMFNESKALYDAARLQFWSNTSFEVRRDTNATRVGIHCSVRDLEAIRHLQLVTTTSELFTSNISTSDRRHLKALAPRSILSFKRNSNSSWYLFTVDAKSVVGTPCERLFLRSSESLSFDTWTSGADMNGQWAPGTVWVMKMSELCGLLGHDVSMKRTYA
ncbi:hypothetical protein LTS10_009026 [Elasticomyces elasticus]|nr:hypothetical protein LTS10_009026 [Elasticomyces elasticus]